MSKLSRRTFLGTTGAGVVVSTTLPSLEAAAHQAAGAASPDAPRSSIRLVVNGQPRELVVEDRWSLAELLRDHLNLTGTKIGCDRGECGACTVLLDGSPIYACSYLAVWSSGRSVETVEGLAANGRLHPLQEAFIEHDAPQCGFCTSGQLMSAKALLAANPHPNPEEVRAALTGNLCRCSNYNQYVEAVVAAGRGARRRSRAKADHGLTETRRSPASRPGREDAPRSRAESGPRRAEARRSRAKAGRS